MSLANRWTVAIVVGLTMFSLVAHATGQGCSEISEVTACDDVGLCPGNRCPATWGGNPGGDGGYQVMPKPDNPGLHAPFDERFHMVVRVKAKLAHTTYGGTGIIVDSDGTRAWVLTAYHTFRDGGTPIVTVYDGRSFTAVITDKDEEADLANLMIVDPGVRPIEMEDEAPQRGEDLWAMGFNGGAGTENFQTFHGKMTQFVTADRAQKYDLVELACAVRKGDSGGPIVNSRGRLVGIIKGSDGRCCNGPCLPRLRVIVRWLLPGPKAAAQHPAPPATSPPVPPPPAPAASPAAPAAPAPTNSEPAIRQLEARIATLEARLETASKAPGPPGKDGRDGKIGPPGPAAVVDYDRLAANIAQKIVPGESDYDKIAVEVAKRLPPIRVQTLKAGKVLAEEKIGLGGVLPLNLVPVKAKK
jgi:hypothetical protein